MDLIATIRTIPELGQVPADQIAWVIEHSDMHTLQQGEIFFKKGDPVDHMIILIKGTLTLKVEQGGNFRVMGAIEAPAITGTLPYSRTRTATGYGEAIENTEVLLCHKEHFRHIVVHLPELAEGLVHLMSSRIRDFTKREQLNDKMVSLGKLSAGLAHELNNPSSAVVRGAQTLSKHLRALPDKFKAIMKIEATDQVVDSVNHWLFHKVDGGIQSLTLLEKSEREDALLDWLEEQNVTDAEDLVENLMLYGFAEPDLETLKSYLRPEDLPAVLHWVNQVLTTERLVGEIEEASQRISDLVTSVKSYTHMDLAPEKKPTNIHLGIENTLTMLNHKIKKAQISVVKNYDEAIAHPSLLASEMNQVWTNLIDNAIDAMETSERRVLTITSFQKGNFINVHIEDSGSGIPQELISQIFDPFFTTKEIGKGTGIGLEVVQRIVVQQHNGEVKVNSEPGSTVFKICLPVAS